MHLKSSLSTLAVTIGLMIAAPASAQHGQHAAPAKDQPNAKSGQLIKVGEKKPLPI
jgi:hypothetical protein